MDKPKFNCYTKVKTTPTPFLFTNTIQNHNPSKKTFKIKRREISKSPHKNLSRHTTPNNRSTTPLNKVSNTQIYKHTETLPSIEAKSPVSRKLNFHSEIMTKSPLLNETSSTMILNKKKELQIIVALKKQIKAQNETIKKYAEEINELKMMNNVASIKEIKIENKVYEKEINKLRKMLQAMEKIIPQGNDGSEGCLLSETQQKRMIMVLKEEDNDILLEKVNSYENELASLKTMNEVLNKQLLQKDIENNNTIEALNNELQNTNKNTSELEVKVDYLEKINDITIQRATIPLLSNNERNDIEYLLKQCLLSRSLDWSILSQIIKENNDLNSIAEVITQHINLNENDLWIIRRYLVDLSIDNNSLIPIESVKQILNDKFTISPYDENAADLDTHLDTEISKLKDIIDKCKEIDIENKGYIDYTIFRNIYNIFNSNGRDMSCSKEFDLIIKVMKRNMSVPFNQLDYNALFQTYIPQIEDNDHGNSKLIHDDMIETQELIIEEEIQKETISNRKTILNQHELIEALKIYFKAKNISFEAFMLPLESKIIMNDEIKCLQIEDFIQYLKENQIINEHYLITFDECYLLGNPPVINISKLSLLFPLNDDNDDHYQVQEQEKTLDNLNNKPITFQGDPQCLSDNNKSLNVKAGEMVNDIFETVLQEQYMRNHNNESKATKLVDELFTKVQHDYSNYLLNPDDIETNNNIIVIDNNDIKNHNEMNNDEDDEFALDRTENKVNNSNEYTFSQKVDKTNNPHEDKAIEPNPHLTEETNCNNQGDPKETTLNEQKEEPQVNEDNIVIEDI